MSRFSEFDRKAMARALEIAARGLYSTDPNPRVGCVITQGETFVSEGWHTRAGDPHAEVNALIGAGSRAAGATVYVTLEPCSHHGRTPACADALIAARVRRVVFALQDPDPRVNGAGAARLRAAGIDVTAGLMADAAAELNIGFVMRTSAMRPWVRLKQAASLDGRTALASGGSRWITGEAAREDVQRWRARSGAILTGIGTVLADDPALNVRIGDEPRRQPLRVVLDSRLRLRPTARMLSEPGPVYVFTTVDKPTEAEALATCGATVEFLPQAGRGVDLQAVVARLAELDVNELWVEAGATLAGALLEADLVDEWILYLAPKVLGPTARPLLDVAPLQQLAEAKDFAIREVRPVGSDLRLILRPRKS
ncbi:MAG TPA: bifunctional diaminohydroxyphosphoribosylaminopyrimidine deaminase/5-amino-6-(5-phosphoribosylamino)uracil reductase RibD [Steroidobacteraceae bacterium]